jgi:hypothetical protein
MTVNWSVVATIAAPIIALFVGAWINRWFESRPNLISYFSHVGVFLATPPAGPPFNVHTHSVILHNAGRRSATGVRLHHSVLPDFNIWPAIVYHVDEIPGGGRDIVIPTMVPNEQIAVSYIYFPPLTYAQVNAGIKCDQGFAQPISVLLQRQYPAWVLKLRRALVAVGIVALLYVLAELSLALVRRL